MEKMQGLTNLFDPLYSIALDSKEKVGELKETMVNRAKSFIKYGEPGDIGLKNRVLSALLGPLMYYSAWKLFFHPQPDPTRQILRFIFSPILAYVGSEFLGAAMTGRFIPIRTYIRERLATSKYFSRIASKL